VWDGVGLPSPHLYKHTGRGGASSGSWAFGIISRANMLYTVPLVTTALAFTLHVSAAPIPSHLRARDGGGSTNSIDSVLLERSPDSGLAAAEGGLHEVARGI